MLVDSLWVEVMNEVYNQNADTFTMFGLTTGKEYTFRVYAVNFNGKSDPSSTLTVYACGVPSNMAAPTFVASDQTSITIQWAPPQYVGGCPIYDYEVQRDDKGAATVWTEVNPVATFTRNDPYTFTFKCESFPALTVIGDSFRFRIKAYN